MTANHATTKLDDRGRQSLRLDPEVLDRDRHGINLGDVVVEADDLLRDGVNVAARLEQLCIPGGIIDFRHGLRFNCKANSACPSTSPENNG